MVPRFLIHLGRQHGVQGNQKNIAKEGSGIKIVHPNKI